MSETLAIAPISTPPKAVAFRVPGSKSITNRALLLAALADGTTEIEGALFSDDTRHMQNALSALGIAVTADEAAARIRVEGTGGVFRTDRATLFTGNAGTAARFLLAAVCLGRGTYVVDGGERMRQRPIGDLVDGLAQLGARMSCPSGCPPVTVEADGLPGGLARLSGARSSQFLSAVLMAAPYAQRPVRIEIVDELIAKPYVDMTLGMMRQFGVDATRDGYRAFEIAAPQRYRALGRYAVEPDASSAHYFLAAAAVLGGNVRVDGIGTGSLQGDTQFAEALARMGAKVDWRSDSIEVTGTGTLGGLDIDMNDYSDTAPTLACIASFASAPVTIRNVAHLRLQESERIAVVTTELRKLGGRVEELPDGWRIEPATLHGGEVDTYDDHRIAMAFAIIGLRVPGIVIRDPKCVRKTFPDYFTQLERLRQ